LSLLRYKGGVGHEDRDPPGVMRVRAPNPSALTLDGTNTYVVGPWVVDPGPLDEGHLEAVRRAASLGIEGVVLTHSHADHAEGAGSLGAPVTLPRDGETVGPFRAVATPGHSGDSVCLVAGATCFTGDTVLGSGSVFVAPGEGSLSAYLDSLWRLKVRRMSLSPSHFGDVLHATAIRSAKLQHLGGGLVPIILQGPTLRLTTCFCSLPTASSPWHVMSGAGTLVPQRPPAS
jgi:glyoxylase-like metal-dependent hydrolase (beta-lactamase superfamily II)